MTKPDLILAKNGYILMDAKGKPVLRTGWRGAKFPQVALRRDADNMMVLQRGERIEPCRIEIRRRKEKP